MIRYRDSPSFKVQCSKVHNHALLMNALSNFSKTRASPSLLFFHVYLTPVDCNGIISISCRQVCNSDALEHFWEVEDCLSPLDNN